MAIRMHNRRMVRIIGEPFYDFVAVPKPKEEVGVLVIAEKPKRVKMQEVEYVTDRFRATVFFSEIYDPREPEEMNLER